MRTWVSVVRAAEWSKPTDIKEMFRSADILANDRVVFNIGGNKYRLVVAVHYRGKRVYIRFVGTHAEYDRIDALLSEIIALWTFARSGQRPTTARH